jgi:predicted enzyme related to lactoylglutathione lyase
MSTFVHMELNTSDPEAAQRFYEEVFGWTYQDTPMPEGIYTMISGPDGGIGGITRQAMADAPSHWVGYVGVDSVAETLDRVDEAGGAVVVPQTEIPGMGSFAIFTDPQWAVFAAWEAAAPVEEEQATEPPREKKSATKKSAKKKSAKKKSAASEPAAEPSTKRTPGKKQAQAPKKKAAKTQPAKKQPAKKAASKKTASKKVAKQPAKKTASKKVAKQPAKKSAKKSKR